MSSANYSKLKNYLNETNSGGNSSGQLLSGLSNVTNSVGDFFTSKIGRPSTSVNGNIQDSRSNQANDDQTNEWFKDADSDPYCPKLVHIYINLEGNQSLN